MFGFDDGRSPYRQAAQDAGTMTVQGSTNDANTRDGIFGFFSRMFSRSSYGSRSSSSGYLQPAMSSSEDVVLCQPVEGVACHPMAGAIACQPVEGIGCQPVTMVPVSGLLPGP